MKFLKGINNKQFSDVFIPVPIREKNKTKTLPVGIESPYSLLVTSCPSHAFFMVQRAQTLIINDSMHHFLCCLCP